MARKQLIYIFLLAILVFVGIVVTNAVLRYEYNAVAILLVVLEFLVIAFVLSGGRLTQHSNGFTYWVNPILILAGILIKKDGVVDSNEIWKVKKYLDREFGEKKGKQKLDYFKEKLEENHYLHDIFLDLNERHEYGEKLKIIQFLTGLSLADGKISEEEEKFILRVGRALGVSMKSMRSIFLLHNHYLGNEKKKTSKVTSSSSAIKEAYHVLGLDPGASLQEVKTSYRSLAKIYHPDKVLKTSKDKEKAKRQFQLITEAYEILKNKLG